MSQRLALPVATAIPIEHDSELAAIAAKHSFEEELREECLHQLRDHFVAEAEKSATTTAQSQDATVSEQVQRGTLILAYLRHVDALLRKFARSTRMDYEDMRQDACIIIMHCLDLKPEQKYTLHRYITTSVRRRIIDKIHYNQHREAESLDAPLGNGSERDGEATLADSLPSGHSIDPMLAVIAREEQREAHIQAKTALRKLSAKKRRTKRVQDALALFQEEVAVR